MINLTVVALFAFAALSQARATQTYDTELVERAAYPRPTCKPISSPPASKCAVKGYLASPPYVGGDTCGATYIKVGGAVPNLSQCQATCENDPDCISMSWNSYSTLCSLYTKTVAELSADFTTPPNNDPNKYERFYEPSCYTCTQASCLPTLTNTGFENNHICPWTASEGSDALITTKQTLSITAKPGQPAKLDQSFIWCIGTPYQISFRYMFTKNIPGSGMDVDYSGLSGTGDVDGTTFYDVDNNDAKHDGTWTTIQKIVTPKYQGDLTFYIYTNPFYSAGQTVLIDDIVVTQQTV